MHSLETRLLLRIIRAVDDVQKTVENTRESSYGEFWWFRVSDVQNPFKMMS